MDSSLEKKERKISMAILLLAAFLSALFIYPVFQGLVLLPLDLLVSNSAPWLLANQILIKNSYMLDSIIQMFPWHHLTFVSLIKGIVPLWNPYQLTGLPFMVSMKPMVFYPLNIFFFLGEIRAWNVLLFFQLFLAFYFMYILARKLEISVWGSILSSIAFAYSSLMVGFLQFGSDGHALVWLPFLFYCLYSYREEKKGIYLIGLSIGLAIGIFAGHLQITAYECLLVSAFILYSLVIKKMSLKEAGMVFAALFLGGGIASIQLLPSIELFSQSFRSLGNMDAQFAGGLIRPNEFLRLFSPDLFGHPSSNDLHIGYIETGAYYGLIPLCFTFFAFRDAMRHTMVKFFCVTCILATLFAMWPFGILISFFKVPLISSGSGGRLFCLALFSGAVLGGYGMDAVIKMNDWKKFFRWVAVYTGFVLCIFITAFIVNKKITYFGATVTNLKFCTAVVVGLFFASLFQMLFSKKWNIPPWIFFVILLLASYFDVFRMGYRFLTFSNSKFMYPDIPIVQFVRDGSKYTLGRVYGLVASEVPTYLGLYTIETYNSLYPVRTARLLRALEGKELSMEPNNVFRFEHGRQLKYVFDTLGVSYIAVQKDVDPANFYFRSLDLQKDLTKIYQDEHLDVYNLTSASPRFGLYYQKKDGLKEEEILTDIKEKLTDLKTTVLLEELLPENLALGTGSSTLRESDINSQKFSVTSSLPALFYVSDAHDKDWRVFVNGKESHLYRANYNFRAVLVPQGESTVVFRYDPTSYNTGKIISGISFLLLGVLLWGNTMLIKRPETIQKKKSRSRKK